MRAILSVSDKTGISDFAKGLVNLGIELFSTGGTKKTLAGVGIKVREIAELTGFPEILDGRVKTLHPMVHGGILARRKLASDMDELKKNHIGLIDIVVVNLYPFLETVARPGATLDEALENIDIGGPTMVRAAAKNFPNVLIIVDPHDYAPLLEKLREGEINCHERRILAHKAFQHVAMYDTAIAQYLCQTDFPEDMTIALKRELNLRYGENPHQKAAFYREERTGVAGRNNIAGAEKLWGKELSFNNILDANSAWRVVAEFEDPTVAIIKHMNPCGLASHPDLAEAYRRALSGDPLSAFGGIVACNRPVDSSTARELVNTFYEVVIAPGYDENALHILNRKGDLRILDMGPGDEITPLDFRRVGGGFLVQTADTCREDPKTWKVVTKRRPTLEEEKSLSFAWTAAKHVKSNAIVLAKGTTLLGMGAGQPSRVDSVEIATNKAGAEAKGCVLASDAMFPFPDGIEVAARAGITAVIQPGGARRDDQVIEVADNHSLAMAFTGTRHFKH